MNATNALPLLGVLLLVALNQAVLRSERLRSNNAVFWALELANVAVALGLAVFGLPGAQPWIGWALGAYLVLRAVQNGWLRRMNAEHDAQRAEIEAEREALRKARAAEKPSA